MASNGIPVDPQYPLVIDLEPALSGLGGITDQELAYRQQALMNQVPVTKPDRLPTGWESKYCPAELSLAAALQWVKWELLGMNGLLRDGPSDGYSEKDLGELGDSDAIYEGTRGCHETRDAERLAKELILTGVKISLPDIACASLVEAIHTLDKLHVGLLRAARVGGEEPEAGNATIPAKSAADEPDRYDERHEMASGTTVDAATVVADFVSAFDKELISIAGTLRSNVPFEDCQKEARTFIDRFAGDRDHPRWANMPLGENYSFINDVPAYNDSPAFSWLFPNGLSSAAANFWFPVVQNLSRFLYFRGTPRQQAKMREQLLEAADDYLDASGYENSEPAVAKLASGNLGQKGPKEPPAPNEATGSDIHAAIIKLAQVLGDENAGKILAITQDSDKTVEEKLRLMSALDRRFKGKSSPQLAELLGVREQAIRKTDWWKSDRHRGD